MPTIKQGLEAIRDVREKHISADTHPMEWNLSVAIEAALTGIQGLQRNLDTIDQRLKRLESGVRPPIRQR